MSKFKLKKLNTALSDKGGTPEYSLQTNDGELALNDKLGKKIQMVFEGEINCVGCDRKIKKSFNQGYCFPCTRSLAALDMCSVRPETCHYENGTCRDSEWAEKNCMISHTVYLAVSSGLKVGITRTRHRLGRWVDQGASHALPCVTVNQRLDAGLVEVKMKEIFDDKTNWRKMLKNEVAEIDLLEAKRQFFKQIDSSIDYEVEKAAPISINYPVLSYPEKVVSIGFDKIPSIEGELLGIKGQYLILDSGVVNMRKHQGYQIEVKIT